MYDEDARAAYGRAMDKWRAEQQANREAELLRIQAEREEAERIAAESAARMDAERAEIRRKREHGAFDGEVGAARRRIHDEKELIRETGFSSSQAAAFNAQSESVRRMNEEYSERQDQMRQWREGQSAKREEELREISEKRAVQQKAHDEIEEHRARIRAKRGW